MMGSTVGEGHRFSATIEAARGGGAVVLVPSEVATALGGLKQVRVVGYALSSYACASRNVSVRG